MSKEFEQSYRVRPAPVLLVERVAGAAQTGLAIERRLEREGASITIGVDSATFRPYERHEVRVKLELADSTHVYASPVPDGFTAFDVAIAPFDGLDVGTARLPEPHPFRIDGLDEDFHAYEGTVEAAIPFNIVPYLQTATLSVVVRYQACTDRLCYPPDSVSVDLALEGVDLVRDSRRSSGTKTRSRGPT